MSNKTINIGQVKKINFICRNLMEFEVNFSFCKTKQTFPKNSTFFSNFDGFHKTVNLIGEIVANYVSLLVSVGKYSLFFSNDNFIKFFTSCHLQ